jgi:hypothetical protein
MKGAVVEKAQQTPNSLIQAGGNYWWFGNTWNLQTPLEHLKDGAFLHLSQSTLWMCC